MKKKILIIVGIFTLLSIAGGGGLLYSINKISSNLNSLLLLHQVEIQREHLLLNIHQVQEDLYSQSARYPESIDTIMDRVKSMEEAIAGCSQCHHSAGDTERLYDLQQQIGHFGLQVKKAVSVLRNERRFLNEREQAIVIGDSLIGKINTMIILTNQRLMDRTTMALRDKKRSDAIVFLLVVAAPLMVAVFGFMVFRSLASPIQHLLAVTKRMQAGDLNVRITGMKNEFAVLAEEFNEMALALRDRMKEISEKERRYRLLFESAADAIFILDAEGKDAGSIVSANQAAAEMHGYTVDELTSMNIRDVDAPRAALQTHERIERLLNGEWIKGEIDHVKKDGTVFPVEISAGMFEFNGHKYILAIDRDTTERNRAVELIQRAEQLRTTGELAAGLAHEIKNPLAGMKITMETLAQEAYLQQEDRDVLFKVIDEIKRIDGLIKGLLNFARPPRPNFMDTDVNTVLAVAAQMVMQNIAPPRNAAAAIEVLQELQPDLPEITADPMQLRQVFMNLLMNAVDAIAGRGTVRLRTSFDAAACAIRVSIADTGKGMDAAELERIFQPFFTTKAGGTGLGLAISKRLIEEQGGQIMVESSVGKGTTFHLTIPSNRDKEAAREES